MTRGGVTFLSIDGFHSAVLRPIMDAIDDRLPVRLVADVPSALPFEAPVIVVPSHRQLERLRRRSPDSWLVNVRHGLVAKGGLDKLKDRPSARRFDAVCFGDLASEERYRVHGAAPQEAWQTGYSQMDPLFRRDARPELGFPPGLPVVLYAPTWNPGLSSAGLLGGRVMDLVSGGMRDVGLVIKPHPTIPRWQPDWWAAWQALSVADPLVHLADPLEDITPLMLASDVLLSDASSTIFEFLALDRPIVVVTNPAATSDPDYDPADLPWSWRDVADDVTDIAGLPATIRGAIAHPEARSDRRRVYRDRLFGPFQDGRNAERIADRLVDLVKRIELGSAPPALRFELPPPSRWAVAHGEDDDESAWSPAT